MPTENKTTLCNLALDLIGKEPLTDIDDGSHAAITCKRHVHRARLWALERSPWIHARKVSALAPITNTLPDFWTGAFDLPMDCVKPHNVIAPGAAIRWNEMPAQMLLMGGSIYTNIESTYLLYIFDNENTQAWPDYFVDLVATDLAYRLSPILQRRNSDVKDLRSERREMLAEAIQLDSQKEVTSYRYGDGYADSASTSYVGPQVDGSTIWDN